MATRLEQYLQRDIERIRGKLLEMAERSEHALKRALKAFLERNRQLAYSVILRDQHIDELENEVDRLCLEFLVRQQPVAGHLRFGYAAIKINAELERIGDYAENIARQVLKISSMEISGPVERYTEMANLSNAMLRDAIQAFINEDAELARRTMATEETVNTIRETINSELVQLVKGNQIPFEAFIPLTTMARRFERVSDQVKNICEEVLYMCTGEYAKHKDTGIFRILFLDEHNSSLSRMAEAIGNALGEPKLVFSSAGLEPRPVDGATMKFMTEKGFDLSRPSRVLSQIPNLESYQVLVALAKGALTAFLVTPAKAVNLDWNVKDPSKVTGSSAEVDAAYEEAFRFIQTHIKDLAEAILGDDVP